MKETAELIDFTFHLDIWSRVLLEERIMLTYLLFQLIELMLIVLCGLFLL